MRSGFIITNTLPWPRKNTSISTIRTASNCTACGSTERSSTWSSSRTISSSQHSFVSCSSFSLFLLPGLSSDNGAERKLATEVSRYLDRPDCGRDRNKAGIARFADSEPLQRRTSHRPPERYGDALVAQLIRSARQASGSQRPRAVPRHRPGGPLQGVDGRGQEDGSLGHPKPQGRNQQSQCHTGIVRGHI